MNLTPLDYSVLAVYGILVAALSLVVARRQKTTLDYFMAGRSVPGWAVGMALMATLISSGTVVGHPATVYQRGLVLLLGTLTLPVVLLFVARFIVPFYRHAVGMSAYEYIGTRFGLGGRMYASAGFVADRLFDLGVTLLTTAIAINVMTGWELTTVILWISFFTIAYTMIGGIEAVVWTSVVQGIVFIGAAVLILLRLILAPEAGAPGAVIAEAWRAGRLSLGNFDLSTSAWLDAGTTTQWLFILAYAVNWSRRYIADQHMVQRYLIARSDREASRGALWNAWLCLPIYATFMFIGACLYGYYQLTTEPAPALPDQVVPYFIAQHMPAGIVGLILAAILAASMSSISADLNSVATVITTDYLAHFRPQTSERARLRFGRLMVVAGGLIAAGVAVLFVPKQGLASVMERGVTIAAILSGGTLGLFFLGFLTRRATRQGCYVGIAACVLFTAWGLLTEPHNRVVDLGFNFELNPILIGVLGHAILFAVGYLASLALGGDRPANVADLTFRRRAEKTDTAVPATAP
ncbi:MAG TPA: sodium/solute symporter [Opitutaceae bacterium]